MTEIVNLTKHALNIHDKSGGVVTVPPSGVEARVSSETTIVGQVNDIAVSFAKFGKVTGLPPEKEGTVYVVSGMVLTAVPNRHDVFAPGQLVRDDAGRPIGCKGLRSEYYTS